MTDTSPPPPAQPASLNNEPGRGGPSKRRLALGGVGLAILVAGVAGLAWNHFVARWHVSTDNAYVGAEVAQITPQVAGTVLSVPVSDAQFVEAGTLLVQFDPADAEIALASARADYEKARRLVRQARTSEVALGAAVQARQADAARAGSDIARSVADTAKSAADVTRARAEAARARAEQQRAGAEAERLELAVRQQADALARLQADLDRRSGLERTGAITHEELAHAEAAVREAADALAAAEAAARAAASAADAMGASATAAEAAVVAAQAQAASVATGTQAARAGQARAAADVVAARGQLASADALVAGFTETDHPDVLRAAARVRQAELDLARTRLVAPFSGVVARRAVQVGQRVAPGTAVMTIVPVNQLYVDANFKESQLSRVMPGQAVTLHADLYGQSVTYHGRVVGIGGGTGSAFALLPAQNATGNWIKVVQRVPVRVALDPAELAAHPLRVGLSMRADIDLHPPPQPARPAQQPAQPVPASAPRP